MECQVIRLNFAVTHAFIASETELKLQVPPHAARSLAAHPLLKGAGRPITKKLLNLYFDTPDLDLCHQGIAFRLRKDGARWVQAVKGGSEVKSGLHHRVELETEVAGPAPDCAAIDSQVFSGLFASPRLCAKLQTMFSTQYSRTSRMVEFKPGITVEVCLDRGVIQFGNTTEAICELELELKSGSPLNLYELALQLLDGLPLRIENRSKSERGYALLRGDKPAPVKASAVEMDKAISVDDAFKAMVWASLNHMQSNERGMLESRDPEYLHQMRVALRRMRSVFSTFADALAHKEAVQFVTEMRWLARELGPARDWDVFMTETLPLILAEFGSRDGMAALRKRCARTTTVARRRAQSAIESVRYQRLHLMLSAWLVAESRFNQNKDRFAASRVTALASAALKRRFTRARKRGRKLRQLSAAELHLLRIAVKKLRYDIDSFAKLYDEKCIIRMLSRVARLQNILGAMNDAATVAGLLQRLGAKSAKDMIEARGMVLTWTKSRAEALKYELNTAWKAFRDCRKCW